MSETTKEDFILGTATLVLYVGVVLLLLPSFPEPVGIIAFILFNVVYWLGLRSWFDLLEAYHQNAENTA